MSGDFCQREGTGAINLNGAAVSRVLSQRKKWRRHRPAESHSLRDPRRQPAECETRVDLGWLFICRRGLDKEHRSCGFATSASKSGALAGGMPRASAGTQRMPTRVCYYSLRGTATALHGGKGKETSLLSIKMQRRADTAQFCNGSDLSSHGCGSTEIGWTLSVWPPLWLEQIYAPSRRFRLPSLHILHVRCQFCVIRAVRRNRQFLPVWVHFRKKSIVQRDGQAQERAQEKLERNRRWFERKISTFLVRAANAPVRAANASVRAANAPYGELHTSTNSRSSDHESGEHTTKRLWSGRGPGQSRSNLRRSKALRWSVRLSSFDTSVCSGTDIVKTSLLAFSWR